MRVWQRGQRYLLRLLWLFEVGLAMIMKEIMRRGRDVDTIFCRGRLVRARPCRCVLSPCEIVSIRSHFMSHFALTTDRLRVMVGPCQELATCLLTKSGNSQGHTDISIIICMFWNRVVPFYSFKAILY